MTTPLYNSRLLNNLYSDDDDNPEEINKINTEIDEEVDRLLKEYNTGNTNIVGNTNIIDNQCPNFFSNMKNKFFTLSNKRKEKVRQYLINKITTEKNSLSEGDPRIKKLDYFLDKMCKCTGTCQNTLQETNFINKPTPSIFSFFTGSKGGRRKRKGKKTNKKSKSQKKRRTRRRR